jgi:TonB family protein
MHARDLSIGILASFCIHALVGIYGLGTILARWEENRILPEFRHGFSSIDVNLVSVMPESVEPEVIPLDPEVLPVEEEPVEPPEEPEAVPEQVILDEGVEQGDPEVTTDVKPSYPIGSRMRGEEGVVSIRVWIDSAGRARRAEVIETSGYAALDRAGLKAAKKAYFRDSKGSLVNSRETEITFNFTLLD